LPRQRRKGRQWRETPGLHAAVFIVLAFAL
jgi:hypothetical protein